MTATGGTTRLPTMAALLACSGACSLIYQAVWLREFRLLVGASTVSSAAVLAVFMGGLGLGGYLLGQRVEKSARPLALYGNLELIVAASAAVSPFVLMALRAIYLAAGGEATLGLFATPLRLLLTALAIGVPVVCMGGTLPAAARAVTTDDDTGRAGIAWLYGINTGGAVVGAVSATFFLLEIYGSRQTLWLAALLNAAVGLTARALANKAPATATTTTAEAPQRATTKLQTLRFAAFASGFVFLLGELVWYRVAAPLLGGSTYSFGVVLAVALAGIGVGGAAYAVAAPRQPTFGMLAASFLCGAVLLALPLFIGDPLALLTWHLRQWGAPSFATLSVSWVLVTAVLVLPFALLCGFQFPLLIALRGAAADNVGRDAGEVYAANTFGSICGSLLGGFVVIPAAGAIGTWRGAVLLLVVVAVVLGLFGAKKLVVVVAAAVVAIAVVRADGPSAVWRHQPIGAGRAELGARTANERQSVENEARRILYEREGRESVVGVTNNMGYSPLVNGKSDGNSLLDAPTAIGSALVPALLHGHVKTGFVIGMGTGQTAGWLGEVPGVERVDVVEIEPAFIEFAELCKDSNADVVHHPRVNTIIGDGREVLLTSKLSYDLILSEPSNPYRSGLASFYSTDFYAGVKAHLNEGGTFGQWMQGYEVGADAVATVAATLKSQFKEVTLWQLAPGDLLFIATDRHQTADVAQLQSLLATEPLQSAFRHLFVVTSVDEFLGLMVGNQALVDAVASTADVVNTDDNNALEYMFARTVGRQSAALSVRHMLLLAASERGADRIDVENGAVDDAVVARARLHPAALEGDLPPGGAAVLGPALATWAAGDIAGAAPLFVAHPPRDALERLAAAEACAHAKDCAVDALIDAVRADGFVAEAGVIAAQAAITSGDGALLHQRLAAAAAALRSERFPIVGIGARLFLRLDQSPVDVAVAEAFAEPFINASFERARLNLVLRARGTAQPGPDCVALLDRFGPPPWTPRALSFRAACFAEFAKDRADAALDDVRAYDAGQAVGFALPR